MSFASLQFYSGAPAFTLDGNTLILTGDGPDKVVMANDSTATQTVNMAIALGSNGTIDTASGDVAVGGDISGDYSLTKAGAGTLTLSGANNTYTGGTIIAGGAVVIDNTSTTTTLGAAGTNLTMGGGSLDLGGSSQTVGALSVTEAASSGDTISNGSLTGTSYDISNASGEAVISANLLANDSIGLTKSGDGTATLSGTNTYTGLTSITAGTLKLGSAGALLANSNVSVNGTLDLNGNGPTVNAFNGGGTVTNRDATAAVLTVSSGNFGGAIEDGDTGTVALTKVGGGNLDLRGENTYTGGTVIASGKIYAPGALAGGSNTPLGTGLVTIEPGANLQLGRSNLSNNFDITDGRIYTGNSHGSVVSGDIVVTGTATIMHANNNGNIDYTGDISGPGGVVNFGGRITQNIGAELFGTNTFAGPATVGPGATFGFVNRVSLPNTGSWTEDNLVVEAGGTAYFNVGQAGNFTAADIDILKALGTDDAGFTDGSNIGFFTRGNFTYEGVIADTNGGANKLGLRKHNENTLTLGGDNTYSGSTEIIKGTVVVSSINSVVDGTAASSLGAPTTVEDGTITLGGSYTTAGLTYVGSGETTDRVLRTTGNSRDIIIDQSGRGLLKFTSDMDYGRNGNNIFLRGSTDGEGEFAGAIGGDKSVGVRKQGSGTWTLSGANLYTGATRVEGGTLVVDGSIGESAVTVNDGGTVGGVGSVKTLTVESGGAVAPGVGVGTLTVKETANIKDGSIYGWEVGQPATGTDVLHIAAGTLDLDNFVLKILDADGYVTDAAKRLPVFTYDVGTVTIDMAGFGNDANNFDTLALGDQGDVWYWSTLALTNDYDGTIYLTGLFGGALPFHGTLKWAAGANGVWGEDVATNWELDGPWNGPGAEPNFPDDPMVVALVDTPHTVTVQDADRQAHSLTVSDGGTVAVDADLTLALASDVNLQGGGTLAVDGTVTAETVTVSGGALDTGENGLVLTRTLQAAGAVVTTDAESFQALGSGEPNEITVGMIENGKTTTVTPSAGPGTTLNAPDLSFQGSPPDMGTAMLHFDADEVEVGDLTVVDDASVQLSASGAATVSFRNLGGLGAVQCDAVIPSVRGAVRPGQGIGILEIGGRLVFEDGSAFQPEVQGADASDVLNVDETLDVKPAALAISWLPGDAADSMFGGRYVVADSVEGIAGPFAVWGGGNIGAAYIAGVEHDVDWDEGDHGIRVTLHAQLAGDVDLDGEVARGDVLALRGGFGSPDADWFDGDVNFDGAADYLDYIAVKRSMGDSAPGGAGAVPEPATLLLLALGALAGLRRRPSIRQETQH